MSRHIHLKKVLCLLLGLILLIPEFLPDYLSDRNALAEGEKIGQHSWDETMNEFLPCKDENTGYRLGSDKYLYYGCHTCTGVTMIVTSYLYGIGWITNDHGARKSEGRGLWTLVGSTEVKGKTKEDLIKWICSHAEQGDVLTNGYATNDNDEGAHTAIITRVDKANNNYRELDEYGSEKKGKHPEYSWRLFEGQKVVEFVKSSTTSAKFKEYIYLYRYKYRKTGYTGEFEKADIKEEVPIFWYEAKGVSVHKEDEYDHGKGQCSMKDLSNRLKIPAGTHVKVLPGIKKSGYYYIYYKPKDKNTGLYGEGVCGYVDKKYIDFGIKIDKSNFPDENFRKYIQSAGFDQDKNGYLSAEEIQKVTEINCKKKNIKDLKGIEHFTSLTALNCSNNKLTSLNVRKNIELTDLFCDSNKLTELDVSNNTKLELLSCADTKLEELDLSNNVKLRQLNCSKNKLAKLDVKNQKNLTILNCSGNQLPSLIVSKNKILKGLDCSNNKLTKLDVTHNTELVELNCSENQLKDLDVTQNTVLGTFYCNDNQIKELNVSKCPKLRQLDCCRNKLTKLDLKKNTGLTSLACNENQLEKLDLSKNTNLMLLGCRANQLKELNVSKCAYLTELFCPENKIKTLDVKNCTSLVYFDCGDNQLEKLDVSKCAQLTELTCSNNQLKSLSLGTKKVLTNLYCQRNKLKKLDISKCPKLKDLLKKGEKHTTGGVTYYSGEECSFAFDSSVKISK